ncbi:MAG: Gfo/Idh/MocA family oxidoreductase [Kiritimatiellia bacterium]
MDSSPLKLGFIGGAPNSAVGYAHFAASRMDHLWELKAGTFSRHPEINRLAAKTYGVAPDRLHASITEMLEGETGKLDAVVLLTPTPLHYQMALQCLNAGVPVICEKAMALTSAEAGDLDRISQERNGFLAVIYNYSGYPMVREMRRMIRDGVLGDILHFQAEMPQEGYVRTDEEGRKPVPQTWRLSDGPVPTLHLDLAVHLHELVHYLTGLKPLSVIADQASRGWFKVIDNVFCLARYTQDVQGHLWFGKSSLGYRNGLRLRLFGSKASVEWYQLNPEEVSVAFTNGRRQIIDRASNVRVASEARYTRFKAGHPAGFVEALANLYVDIHAALQRHKETGRQQSDEVFGPALAVEGLKCMEGMARSCETGKWERV